MLPSQSPARPLGLLPTGTKARVTAARFLWGWGGVRATGRLRPTAAARGRAVFRGPRPPRPARSSGVTLASPRLARCGGRSGSTPPLGPGVGLGEVGALLALGARLQTPAELGSSQQNLGDAAGYLGRGSEADEGAPSTLQGSLGAPSSLRIHPRPIYSCSAKCRRRGCGAEHGPCLPSGSLGSSGGDSLSLVISFRRRDTHAGSCAVAAVTCQLGTQRFLYCFLPLVVFEYGSILNFSEPEFEKLLAKFCNLP